VQKKNIDKLW